VRICCVQLFAPASLGNFPLGVDAQAFAVGADLLPDLPICDEVDGVYRQIPRLVFIDSGQIVQWEKGRNFRRQAGDQMGFPEGG
jgi:hypothetical protein